MHTPWVELDLWTQPYRILQTNQTSPHRPLTWINGQPKVWCCKLKEKNKFIIGLITTYNWINSKLAGLQITGLLHRIDTNKIIKL
jgi:hypothetical protein